MGMAQRRLQWEEEQKKKKQEVNPDTRSTPGKVFDTFNLLDSGRSFTTATPSKEGSEQDAGEQAKGVVKSLFSGTEKVGDAIDALTGTAERRQKELDLKLQNKEITREEYQAELKKMMDDTAWAGTEDKGTADRLKKSAGVALEATSEFLPIKVGAKAGKAAKEAIEETGRVSKMARARVAADTAAQGAAVGAVGGGAGAAAEDSSTSKDIGEGVLSGLVGGGVLGAAGSQVGLRKALLPDERGSIQAFRGSIGDDLKTQVDRGKIEGNIVKKNADELEIDADSLGEIDPLAVEDYANRMKRGDTLDPVVIKRGSDGKDYISVGRHRYLAAQSLGIKDIPTVRQKDNVTVPSKVIPPTVESLPEITPSKVMAAEAFKVDPMIEARIKDQTNINEFGKLRKQAANDEDFYENVLLQNIERQDFIGSAARYISREHEGKGVPLKDLLDEVTKPLEGAGQSLSNNLNQLKTDIRKTLKQAGASDQWSNMQKSIKDMNEQEQYDYLLSGYKNMRDTGTLASIEVGGAKVPKSVVQLRVLSDLQDEARLRSPGGDDIKPKQKTETQTQKGAQYIIDDIDKLQKETGIDVTPIDRKVAAALTGEVRRSGFQEFKDKMGKNFQDTLTYAARTTGRPGVEFVYDMLKGNKFKRDALDALRDPMNELSSLNKKLSGKSLTSRRDIGARIGQALDDRANVDTYITNPDERKLFDNYVKVFDYVKELREKSGLETLENYRPWVNMKEAAEPPVWLAENVTNKRTNTISRFSKERTKTEAGEDVENNLADMIYGYVNSQLNEMAYDAPVKRFKGNFDTMAAGNKANVGTMNEGVDYLRTLVEQAVNPARKSPVERGAAKLTSNVYGAVLPFNIRLAIQNKTQKLIANSRVSKGARKLAKQMDENDLKELEGGLVFGDKTVYGQLEDVNPTSKGSSKGLLEKTKKVDPYQRSERDNVLTSYNKGAAQAILESDPYKNAIKAGSKPKDAAKIALSDPQVKENAIRRGNVVVNDTQFGASPLARPEMLREEGSIWGILPKKTIYMFTRFPIGMSNHVLEALDNKSTRALELLKNGDPRAMSISEMRTNYRVLLDSMKDAKKAIKEDTDIGIPEQVLDEQISFVTKNLDTIDKEAKKLSQVRGGKTVKNLGKMWAAAAAIQIVFDSGIQAFADDPVATTAEAANRTNPTLGNRVVGSYSPLASITSSASPLDRYGNVNERAITNYIPGVGLAVNRGRDIKKLSDSLLGESEE